MQLITKRKHPLGRTTILKQIGTGRTDFINDTLLDQGASNTDIIPPIEDMLATNTQEIP